MAELTGRRIPVDLSRLELLANYLRRGPAAEKSYGESDLSWRGEPGSISRSEREFVAPSGSHKLWSRAVDTTYAAARLGLISMGEHSLCIARLITDLELGAYGLLGTEVLCRSAVETGARAWWLLDPSIDPRQRVIRSFIDEFYNACEMDNLNAKMSGTVRGQSREVATAVEDRCGILGLSFSLKRKNWTYTVEGQSRLGATDIVTKMIETTPYAADRDIVYSLLSGATHGAIHSLMRSYIRVGTTAEGEDDLFRIVDHRLVEASAGLTMACLLAVLRRAVLLNGWPRYRIDSLSGMTHSVLSDGPR